MTSHQFQIAAKNAVIKVVEAAYEEQYAIEDINITWFSYVLGNMKCLLIDSGKNNRYYEVTYNRDKNELYVDTYEKRINAKFDSDLIEKMKVVQ